MYLLSYRSLHFACVATAVVVLFDRDVMNHMTTRSLFKVCRLWQGQGCIYCSRKCSSINRTGSDIALPRRQTQITHAVYLWQCFPRWVVHSLYVIYRLTFHVQYLLKIICELVSLRSFLFYESDRSSPKQLPVMVDTTYNSTVLVTSAVVVVDGGWWLLSMLAICRYCLIL